MASAIINRGLRGVECDKEALTSWTSSEEIQRMLQNADVDSRVRLEPTAPARGDFLTHQFTLWERYFIDRVHPPLPAAWLTSMPAWQSANNDIYRELHDTWAEESAYVVHDIICQVWTEYPDFWDGSRPLFQYYDFIIREADQYPQLLSDEIRPPTDRRPKRPSPPLESEPSPPTNYPPVDHRGRCPDRHRNPPSRQLYL